MKPVSTQGLVGETNRIAAKAVCSAGKVCRRGSYQNVVEQSISFTAIGYRYYPGIEVAKTLIRVHYRTCIKICYVPRVGLIAEMRDQSVKPIALHIKYHRVCLKTHSIWRNRHCASGCHAYTQG